jgi:AcrR family transcriptional regulator
LESNINEIRSGMAPRPYSLGKRAQLAEATRGRILDAIVQLHAERGIASTTATDVAARADVAVATVSRYFPSVEEMVKACGAHLRMMVPLPTAAMFDGAGELEPRVRILVERWYAFYEGMAPWLRHAYADAERVPALGASLSRTHQHHEEIVRLALAPFDLPARVVGVTIALTSAAYWRSIADTGLRSADAAAVTTEMLLGWIRGPQSLITTTGVHHRANAHQRDR